MLLLQNHWANFSKTWHKASLPWVKGIQVCSNESVKFTAIFILNIEIEPLSSDKLQVFHNRSENDWMLSLMRWTFIVT